MGFKSTWSGVWFLALLFLSEVSRTARGVTAVLSKYYEHLSPGGKKHLTRRDAASTYQKIHLQIWNRIYATCMCFKIERKLLKFIEISFLSFPDRGGDTDRFLRRFGGVSVSNLCRKSDYPDWARGCIQKFSDWPPGARTANGTALCH
jgi:hypothetical protein